MNFKIIFLNIFLPIIIVLCSSSASSQNLAPNPGFENTTVNCTDTVSEMFTDYSQTQNWIGTACDTCAGKGSTPGYFNSLCNRAELWS
jgi:hypothetical protein